VNAGIVVMGFLEFFCGILALSPKWTPGELPPGRMNGCAVYPPTFALMASRDTCLLSRRGVGGGWVQKRKKKLK